MDVFDDWYCREHPRVLAACAALTGEVDAAGEATDEAFVRALERWDAVATMLSPGGWVQVVALNHLRRALRRRRRERVLAGSARRGLTGGEFTVEVPDREVWAVVALLPARQRTAIVLRYVHDLPEAAIAELIGVTRGTVASTISAAHAGLRARLSVTVTTDEPFTDKEASHG